MALNNEDGVWQNIPTFKRGILKLNDGRSCEVAIKYEQEQRKSLTRDNRRITAERDTARSELFLSNQARQADQKAASENVGRLTLQLQTEQTKHFKGTLRLVGIGIGAILGVWGATKVGIL